MKRSELARKTALARRTGLARTSRLSRSRPRPSLPPEDLVARQEFKRVRDGICKVCGARGLVRRHHIVTEQHVAREGGNLWDLRNGLWVGVGGEAGEYHTCDCHRAHHNALKNGKPWRIPVERLPVAAFDFATELLGEPRARDYFRRWYDTTVVA